jgi:2-ketocyclohexanecarboxyl-CoA hydrolase
VPAIEPSAPGGDVNIENEDTFSGRGEAAAFDEGVKVLYQQIRRGLKPVIARVNRYAIGGGNHRAYVCDFTIASDKSIFLRTARVWPARPTDGWSVISGPSSA